MTIEEIKELIQVVLDTGIAELEVQRGDNRVKIRGTFKGNHEIVIPAVLPAPPLTPVQAAVVQAALSAEGIAAAAPGPKEDDNDTLVKSPIVGTYYDCPAPGSPAFVKIGDRVEPKQVLCIIESMKLMNEIEAETAGTVIAKHVENGRPVEYGELLFTIRSL